VGFFQIGGTALCFILGVIPIVVASLDTITTIFEVRLEYCFAGVSEA